MSILDDSINKGIKSGLDRVLPKLFERIATTLRDEKGLVLVELSKLNDLREQLKSTRAELKKANETIKRQLGEILDLGITQCPHHDEDFGVITDEFGDQPLCRLKQSLGETKCQ